jgi:hypothetical protein
MAFRFRFPLTLLVFVLGVAANATAGEAPLPSDARAAPPTEVEPGGPFRYGVFGNVGAFSAVGFLGVSSEFAVRDTFDIEAGVGYGLSGLQLSLMPKRRFGGKAHALVLGLGPAAGINVEDGGVSLWLNGDVGYEYRARKGFSVGIMVGGTVGLAGCLNQRCRPDGGYWGEDDGDKAWSSERARDYWSPQARLIVGQWFP